MNDIKSRLTNFVSSVPPHVSMELVEILEDYFREKDEEMYNVMAELKKRIDEEIEMEYRRLNYYFIPD